MEPSIGVVNCMIHNKCIFLSAVHQDDIKAQAKDFETEIDKQELERIMHWATDD